MNTVALYCAAKPQSDQLDREGVLTNGNSMDTLRAISGMRHFKSTKSRHTFVCMKVLMDLIG